MFYVTSQRFFSFFSQNIYSHYAQHEIDLKMEKDSAQWDYELLAVLSMYAETSIKELKKTITKLSKDLHIDLSAKP